MADSGAGLERSIEAIGYSPVTVVDGGNAALTPSHPTILAIDDHHGSQADVSSLLKLGALKEGMGKDAEAEEFFRRALELGERTLGRDHPEIILVLNDLTRLYLRQSAYSSAEALLLRLLEMKRSKGEDHPEVATVLASLASVRQALGRHESAEQLWRRVLDIRERTLAPNHFAIATALEHFGDSCAARGKISEALEAFERALTIRERTLGSEDPSLRVSRERIADLQLQASEVSLDLASVPDAHSLPARYRLLSGDPRALTGASPLARHRSPALLTMKTGPMVERPFAEDLLADEQPHARLETGIDSAPTPQMDAVSYSNALESIWDELDTPRQSRPFGERRSEFLAPVVALLGQRQLVAAVVVLVMAFVLVVVSTRSNAWGDADRSTAVGSVASNEYLPATNPAISTSSVAPANDRPAAAANGSSAKIDSRVRATPERTSSKKVPEKKPEPKAVAIPTLSKAVRSRLDSVLSRAAANTSTRLGDPIALGPAPTQFGSRRISSDDADQASAPRRARLIGELPIPTIPKALADVEGIVRVRFSVDADGRPVMTTFTVLNSPNPMLTAAVRKVIPGMHFEPARSGGAESKPIADVLQIEYQFSRPNQN